VRVGVLLAAPGGSMKAASVRTLETPTVTKADRFNCLSFRPSARVGATERVPRRAGHIDPSDRSFQPLILVKPRVRDLPPISRESPPSAGATEFGRNRFNVAAD